MDSIINVPLDHLDAVRSLRKGREKAVDRGLLPREG
jgi:hypothetical protein